MSDETRVWIVPRKLKKKTAYDLRWWDAGTGKYRSRCVGTDKRRADREAAQQEKALNEGTYHEVERIPWQVFVDDHVGKIQGAVNAVRWCA